MIMSANDMTRYALLLRGVNMMGKNTLVMSRFVQDLTGLGLYNVSHYINSGNVFLIAIGLWLIYMLVFKSA